VQIGALEKSPSQAIEGLETNPSHYISTYLGVPAFDPAPGWKYIATHSSGSIQDSKAHIGILLSI
jgi:hypothetical protein